HRLQIPGDLRPDVHRLDRLQVAGELGVRVEFPLDRVLDGDDRGFGRLHRRRRRAAAHPGGQNGRTDHGRGDAARHGQLRWLAGGENDLERDRPGVVRPRAVRTREYRESMTTYAEMAGGQSAGTPRAFTEGAKAVDPAAG